MASVTSRIKEIKQPRGGYIRPSEFKSIVIDDGITLNEFENIHSSIIGLTVDYLTRFLLGTKIKDAFKISFQGAEIAEKFGIKNAKKIAKKLSKDINSINDSSVINACKLVTFDVWFRNPVGAILSKKYNDTNPDRPTIENIQTLVKRSLAFFDTYGDVVIDGFTFEPVKISKKMYKNMILTKKGSYGGYTATVDRGDGDFLTSDTLWDFKVSKSKPTSKHTLQVLMYWIMGQHSGKREFKNIVKLGIFNPRLNTIYLLEISKVPQSIIKTIEREVICYDEL